MSIVCEHKYYMRLEKPWEYRFLAVSLVYFCCLLVCTFLIQNMQIPEYFVLMDKFIGPISCVIWYVIVIFHLIKNPLCKQVKTESV
jgi:hypothetical protein